MCQLLMPPNFGTVSSNGTLHPFASSLLAWINTMPYSDNSLCIHCCCASTTIGTC